MEYSKLIKKMKLLTFKKICELYELYLTIFCTFFLCEADKIEMYYII